MSGLALLTVTSVTDCPSGMDGPSTIIQLRLQPRLKFTMALLGSRPLTRLGSFKIRQQISFLTLLQFKDSSLVSFGSPGMMTTVA